MSAIAEFKNKRAIQEEAANWIIKIDNRPLTDDEQIMLREWLGKNKSHRKEFFDLASVWNQMDILKDYREYSDLTDSEQNQPVAANTARSLFHYGVAASLLVICGGLFFAFTGLQSLPLAFVHESSVLESNAQNSNHAPNQNYATQVGEIRSVQLADGSRIKLNTNTRISVQYSDKTRSLTLLQGEANFEVAKDKLRPFTVYVGGGSVTAVGTVFNIRVGQQTTDVVVTEGVVNIASVASVASPLVDAVTKAQLSATNMPAVEALSTAQASVNAGKKVTFSQQAITAIKSIDSPAIEQELSWHSGMLSFADTPLSQVIDEVSRYTTTQILIRDPDIAQIPVGGYFKAGETEAMLEVLQLSFGINVVRVSDTTLVLTKNEHQTDYWK